MTTEENGSKWTDSDAIKSQKKDEMCARVEDVRIQCINTANAKM